MSLRFIVGRAGTGKTRACLDAVQAELERSPAGPALIVLVPEQATFQIEQALVARVAGFVRAHVLSFRRLAWRVLSEVGGIARPVIGELGRRMVLRALLARRAGQLRLFHHVAGRPGFIERLSRSITELRAYGVTTGQLDAVRQGLESRGAGDTPLAGKLHDLALLAGDLEGYLADRFTSPDDSLTLLAEHLPAAQLVRGAEVWVDGFQGFTPQEFRVLAALLRCARRVHVALTLDSRVLAALDAGVRPHPEDLFYPTASTYLRLRALAHEGAVPVEAPLITDGGGVPARFRQSPALAYLERAFFDPEAPALVGEMASSAEAVTLVAAANRRAEVEAAGREILRLSREEGYRFRDMAVIVRDLEGYHDLVSAVFQAYGIPHFIDRRRPVLHHPLVELVRSALEVVISDWAYDPVFRLLKTDLVPVPRERVDVLENYVLEHGIRGWAWYRGGPWRYRRRFSLETEDAPPSSEEEAWFEELNRIREQATGALIELWRRTEPARRTPQPVRALTESLFLFLEAIGARDTLLGWSREAEQQGDPDAAQEHLQVWMGLLELLDQVVESLGEQAMTLQEFLEVLEAGIEGLEVGLIPPGLDQVIVGSVERSRHPELRAAFVLGVAEGVFPRPGAEDVIFSDLERERLAEEGLELAPTARQATLEEQFRVYLALTRAQERLWLSHPTSDERGRPVWPSTVFTRAGQLLPGARRLHAAAAGSPGDPVAAVSLAELAGLVGFRLRQALRGEDGAGGAMPWLALYQWLVTDPAVAATARPVLAGLGYRNDAPRVPEELAWRLYGGPVIRTSVTRLESLAACPFRHFAAHGLRLAERPIFQLGPPQLGLLQHAAMRLLLEELSREPEVWDSLDMEEAGKRVAALVERLAPRLRGEGLLSTGQERYLLTQVNRTLAQAAVVLAEHHRRGRFRPVALEVPFGDSPGLPGVVTPVAGGGQVILRGRIDRLDAAVDARGRVLLRVLDYKSRGRELDLASVYHGLSLQLPLYLMVALAGAAELVGGPVEPAGLLYFPLAARPVVVPHPLEPERALAQWRREMRMAGLVVADPDVVRLMEDSGAGELVPARLRKDGQVARGAGTVATGDLWRLLRHVQARVADLVGQMLAGEVGISPYRLGSVTACAACPYRPVCRLDPRAERDRIRNLERLRAQDVWHRLEPQPGEGRGHGLDA